MEIHHRISFTTKERPDLLSVLNKMNIQFVSNPISKGSSLISFDIKESDPRWDDIKDTIKNLPDLYWTTFSDEEILKAEWLRFIPLQQLYYPQPESNWISSQPSFYEDYCVGCGTYSHQKKNFRIKKEPDITKTDFFSLYWSDPILCNKKVLAVIEQNNITGYKVRELIRHSSGVAMDNVCQLDVVNLAPPGLVRTGDLPKHSCSTCGTLKYNPHNRGIMYFKREALADVGVDIIRSSEWFGTMKSAYREYLISNRLAKLILNEGWKGFRIKVVELID